MPPSDDSPRADSEREEKTFSTRDGVRVAVEVVATRLDSIADLAVAPDGRVFVAERAGRIRVIDHGTLLDEPALSLAALELREQWELSSIALHPRFLEERFIYVASVETHGSDRIGQVVRYRDVANSLGEPALVVGGIPVSRESPGPRLRFGPDERIYIAVGDGVPTAAETLGMWSGTMLRLDDEGLTPLDNPLSSPVFASGLREPVAVLWPSGAGQPWVLDRGSEDAAEVRPIEALVSHGRNQVGRPALPVLRIPPTEGASGALFYTGSAFPAFLGQLFVACLDGEHVHRIHFDGSGALRAVREERLLEGAIGRLSAVALGADGTLYLAARGGEKASRDSPDDWVVRLVPVRTRR